MADTEEWQPCVITLPRGQGSIRSRRSTTYLFIGLLPSLSVPHPIDRPTPPPKVVAVESDFVVILTALLCALICVIGLIAVACCAWLRRGSGASTSPTRALAKKDLKKKVLQSISRFTYVNRSPNKWVVTSECAICLAKFADRDEIRVLPQCGHGFHMACIDTWLGSVRQFRPFFLIGNLVRIFSPLPPLPLNQKGLASAISWFTIAGFHAQVEMIEPSVKGTANVLKAYLEAKVERIVFVSSRSAISMNPTCPRTE